MALGPEFDLIRRMDEDRARLDGAALAEQELRDKQAGEELARQQAIVGKLLLLD